MNVLAKADLALTSANLGELKASVRRFAYDRAAVDVGIVHIGPGAFHRAHQASFVDDLLARDPRWGICGISLQTPGLRDALKPQDFLYTLAVLAERPEFRIIGALKEVIVAPEAPEKALARLADPRTQVVTITVTEKGYCLDGRGALDAKQADIAHDWSNRGQPKSVIGVLTEALRRRRAERAAPFTVISCDNLTDNGMLLRNAVLRFAREADRDLSAWIEGEVRFPRTMVDSITPATDDALRARVAEATGLVDRWPVQREAFAQWVIEDSPGLGPDWRSVGVTISNNVSGYERAKLRLLNGAHSSLAYLGLLKGYETVAEAMGDAALAAWLRAVMIEDIAPTARAPKELDVAAYIEEILRRFRNGAVRHLLSQIAWDGSQKLPIRLLKTIGECLITARPIARLSMPIAAWLHFVRKTTAAGQKLVDPLHDALADAARAGMGKGDREAVGEFLKIGAVFPATLTGNANFVSALETAYQSLKQQR